MHVQTATHRIEVEPGLTLFVLEKFVPQDREPSPGKAILCLPGSGVDHRAFDCPIGDYSVLDFLARQSYRAFGVDFRGSGQSSRPADGKTVTAELCLADTLKVMEAIRQIVGCEQVSLLGASFGSFVAAMAAERAPALVDKLVLTGFVYADVNPSARQMLAPEALQAIAKAPNGYTRSTPQLLWASMPCAAREVIDWNLATFSHSVPVGPMLSAASLPLVQDPARIVAPVLIINGVLEIFATEADSRAFLERVSSPVKALHLLPDAGHVPFFERGHRQFQQLVTDFLQA